MVKHLMTSWCRIAPHVVALALLQATSLHASAQALIDPTRPPASRVAEVQTANMAPVLPAGPVLQSVLISSTRMVAVINGQAVQLGGKYGDARVEKITEDSVVLRNGAQSQTLKLFPAIEKLPATIYAGPKLARQP